MSEEAHLGMSDSKIWVSEHQRILDSRIKKVHQPVVWEKALDHTVRKYFGYTSSFQFISLIPTLSRN